jgi:hypothetical protein
MDEKKPAIPVFQTRQVGGLSSALYENNTLPFGEKETAVNAFVCP